MRKGLAAILLMLIFYSQVGYYGYYTIEQQVIRYEQKLKMLASLDDAALERIPYHPEMTFMDDGREFSFRGAQYDIVRTREENHVMVYYALTDRDESRLLQKMAHAVNHQSQDNGAKKGVLKIWTVYCEPFPQIHLTADLPTTAQHPVLPDLYDGSFSKVSTPPPDPARI